MKKLLSVMLAVFSLNSASEAKNYVFTSNGMQLLKYNEDFSSLRHVVDFNLMPIMDPNNPIPPMPDMPWNIMDIKANNEHVFVLMMPQNMNMPYDPNNPSPQPQPNAQLRIYNAHDLQLLHTRDLLDIMPMDKFDVSNNIVKIYHNNQPPVCPPNPMPPYNNPCMMMGLETLELTFVSDGLGGLTSTERNVQFDYSKIYFFQNNNTLIDDLPQNPNIPYGPYTPNPMPGFGNKVLALNGKIYGISQNMPQKGLWLQTSNNACQRHYHDLSMLNGEINILECSSNYIYVGNFERIHLLDPNDLSLKSEVPYMNTQWMIVADINE
jgi:hypothetical protein